MWRSLRSRHVLGAAAAPALLPLRSFHCDCEVQASSPTAQFTYTGSVRDSLQFSTRRSPVLATRGAVAASQPLAAEAGLSILKAGGNAVDAAVAVAAALAVTEPGSTGLGGDAFMLVYEPVGKRVRALNGSGRAPKALTRERVASDCPEWGSGSDLTHPHTVTVPGAAAMWDDAVRLWGRKTLTEVLEPATRLAADGFPVAPVTSAHWRKAAPQIARWEGGAKEILIEDGGFLRGPLPGEIMRNPALAAVLRDLAARGAKKGFYQGAAGRAIVAAIAERGGVMTEEDLAMHESTQPPEVPSVELFGVELFEHPPNGSGIAALLALNTLRGMGVEKLQHNSPEYLHLLIEVMRLAFADARWYVADPAVTHVPVKELLSEEYAAERRKLFNPSRAQVDVQRGSPVAGSDTVSFSVVDGDGMAVSFVNSIYMSFGSCIAPLGCGFTLQNRGANFSVQPGHPNEIAGGKRPYHTIIPAMMIEDGELYAAMTNMGGFMQPQGHVQLFLNQVVFGMDAQTAIDMPRFCLVAPDGTADAGNDGVVVLEDGMPAATVDGLRRLGHRVRVVAGHERATLGRATIIQRASDTGVLWAGADGRSDGLAIGF